MIAEADDTDDEVNDPSGHRRFLSVIQLPPRPVFRNPFERVDQPRESTTSPSRCNEIGGSQGER